MLSHLQYWKAVRADIIVFTLEFEIKSMLRTVDPCCRELQLGWYAPEWILGNILILKTLIFKQGSQCLTFLLLFSLWLWVRRPLLGSGVIDCRSRFSAVGERGWSTALISSLLANSICSGLTTHTINKGAFRDCWVMCHWVGDRQGREMRGLPATHSDPAGGFCHPFHTAPAAPGNYLLSFCVIANLAKSTQFFV